MHKRVTDRREGIQLARIGSVWIGGGTSKDRERECVDRRRD